MRKLLLPTFLSVMVLTNWSQDQTLIPFGSSWKYLDDGSNQGTTWRGTSFNDASWSTGLSEFGYGDGDEVTTVSYGSNSSDKHITTYFRHTLNIADIGDYENFLIKLIKDDGALVYVNGQNVMRSNFGTNTYTYDDESYSSISGSEETIIWEEIIPASYFQTGSNVIAVEVHQYSNSSSDLSFNLELIGFDSIPSLYREPYIQMTTPTSAIIKWKTDIATTSRVKYGSSLGTVTTEVDNLTPTINHEVEISGLSTDTQYYYAVGDTTIDFTTAGSTYFFKTNPAIGASHPTRVWVTGDAGTGKTGQLDVRDAYLNYAGSTQKADLWLMMGDNAYEHGRESDYHMGLFNVYEDVLRNTVSFPTSGNHDFYGEANPNTQTGPYFDIFALPKNGECGGVASGTEAYYSYDYGDIHFVCLESYGLNRDSSATMGTWLKNDLDNTTAKWLVAYWHYAPYTKVGHDSDDPGDHSGRAIEMRENFNPILERYGVDLILSGHSHGYERSFLLNGHYGYSNSLINDMIISDEGGQADLTGAYVKPQMLTSNNGAVYVVCGSSGKLSSHTVPHPAMYTTNTDYHGSVIIDIANDTLECKFLNENGIIQDYFHIVKSASAEIQEKPSVYQLYPNPTTSSFSISTDTPVENGRIEIYSIKGEMVKAIDLKTTLSNGSSYPFSVADLSAGIYTVKLSSGNELLKSDLLVIE